MRRPLASRSFGRRFRPLELAFAFALGGSFLAIAVPAFLREVHASRFVEPVGGLERIGAAAVAYGRAHPVAQGFPASVALTPSTPPRGHCTVDPPGAWYQPTWRDLDFQPAPSGTPHCFAFAFDSALSAARSTFRAQAHGDLDGDGVMSTFEVTGQYAEGDARGPIVDPGLFVDSEIE